MSRTITVRESYDLSQLRFPRLWVTNAVQTGVLWLLWLKFNAWFGKSILDILFHLALVDRRLESYGSGHRVLVYAQRVRISIFPDCAKRCQLFGTQFPFLVWPTHPPKSSTSCSSSWSKISPIGWPASWERKARNVLWNSTRSVRWKL